MNFMQTAPWLGLLPGADGQILPSQDGDSPVVSLFKSTAAAMVSYPGCPSPNSFHIMSKQAEAAGMILYCVLISFVSLATLTKQKVQIIDVKI
jgi:cytoplasmic FMR1 interacting protein